MTNTPPSTLQRINTLGELRETQYKSRSIKEELRENLYKSLEKGKNNIEGIIGYEDTVIPDLQTAILSQHNILLLGLRGQAKTKIARLMTNFLDEWMPVIEGSEVNDDPFAPISRQGIDLVTQLGDQTPIRWIHRSERYVEKLATPDVSVADLIGDLDAIKAAALKLPYSDERVIHFGLVPRAHRSIFVINELPDLQPRIQVALFNILQEKDIQIRGFKVRLPLDVCFIFTANPEDYTNRGSIVTPLKDRIESQILTHYPKTIEIAKKITQQEARILPSVKAKIQAGELIENIVEQIAFEARESEYIDSKSGVSARLTISAYENLYSYAERRLLINKEKTGFIRISDLYAIVPSITGKVELVYEGEQTGTEKVAFALINKSIRSLFPGYFPTPETGKKNKTANPYQIILDDFSKGKKIDFIKDSTTNEYVASLNNVDGLRKIVQKYHPNLSNNEQLVFMEFLLHGLAEFSQINRSRLEKSVAFRDMLGGIFSSSTFENWNTNDEDE